MFLSVIPWDQRAIRLLLECPEIRIFARQKAAT